METKPEMLTALEARFIELADWFAARPGETFTAGPEGRWTEGQHLAHLIQSTAPLNKALRLPKMVLQMKFGTAKAPAETTEELAARYEATLADGAKATGPFIPEPVAAAEKERLLASFREEGRRLVEVAGKWGESDLDKYLLPHPLLGNLTIRGMLFFTWHHMGHHLETLQRDYGLKVEHT